MKFETRLLHYDPAPGDSCRPANTPIYQTATFRQDSATEFGEYDYSRSGNPTRAVLEGQLAALENGSRGFCFGTGLAAITAVTRLLKPGEEIVACDDLYGGTYRLFSKVYQPKGHQCTYLSAEHCNSELADHLEGASMLWLESPTNPLLNIGDIAAAATVAHSLGVTVVVDYTFASPYLQRPLELGADIVVHSATKYLGGHSDLACGIAAPSDAGRAERRAFLQNSRGAVASRQ